MLPSLEQSRGGGRGGGEGGVVVVGGVHPNQTASSPPAQSAEGPSDFCMQTHSRNQLEPSLSRADKDLPQVAFSASLYQ